MFDIGFSELLVIGVVALIVIGPERLPRVARTVGILMGRMQRYVSDVKADINREIELDELRKMRDSIQQAAGDIETSVQKELRETEQTINSALASPAEDHSAAQTTASSPSGDVMTRPEHAPGSSAAAPSTHAHAAPASEPVETAVRSGSRDK